MILVHFLLTLKVSCTTQRMTTGFVRPINSYMYLVQSSKITKAFLMSLSSAFVLHMCFWNIAFNVMTHGVFFSLNTLAFNATIIEVLSFLYINYKYKSRKKKNMGMRGDSVHLETFWGVICTGWLFLGGFCPGGDYVRGIMSVPPITYIDLAGLGE